MTFQTYKPKKSSPLRQVFTASDEDTLHQTSAAKGLLRCYRCQALFESAEAVKNCEVHCKRDRVSFVGTMEESLLHNKASSSMSTPSQFSVYITIDHKNRHCSVMPAIFHKWTNSEYQTPYVGTINLAQMSPNGIGLATKKAGTLEVNIFNKDGKPSTDIEIGYDFHSIPCNSKAIVRYSESEYTVQTIVTNLNGTTYFTGVMSVIFHNKYDDIYFKETWTNVNDERDFIILACCSVDPKHYTRACHLCEDDQILYSASGSSSTDAFSSTEDLYLVPHFGSDLGQKQEKDSAVDVSDYEAEADAFLKDLGGNLCNEPPKIFMS